MLGKQTAGWNDWKPHVLCVVTQHVSQMWLWNAFLRRSATLIPLQARHGSPKKKKKKFWTFALCDMSDEFLSHMWSNKFEHFYCFKSPFIVDWIIVNARWWLSWVSTFVLKPLSLLPVCAPNRLERLVLPSEKCVCIFAQDVWNCCVCVHASVSFRANIFNTSIRWY